MAKTSKARQAIIEAAKKMPPLFHKIPGEDFDYRKARNSGGSSNSRKFLSMSGI